MMKKTAGAIIWLMVITMELFPQGAVLQFENPRKAVPIRMEFSYFDMKPLMYGNIGPFITAILSVLAVIFFVIYCKSDSKKVLRGLKNVSAMALIVSCTPILLGIHYLSRTALDISFLLLLALCWSNFMIDWT